MQPGYVTILQANRATAAWASGVFFRFRRQIYAIRPIAFVLIIRGVIGDSVDMGDSVERNRGGARA